MFRVVLVGAATLALAVFGAGATAATPAPSRQIAYIGKIPDLHRLALYIINTDGRDRQLITRVVVWRTSGRMPEVAFITTCAECRRQWLPDDEDRWRAYHGLEEHVEEPPELVFYCPACVEREFGGN